MSAAASVLFVWKPEFALGMDEVDAQHRNLFRIGGELQSRIGVGTERAVIAPLVAELAASIRKHFDSEEELMRAHGLESYESHKAEHEDFLGAIAGFASDFEAGRANVTPAVLQFVQDWILKHIAGADRTMAAACRDAGRPASELAERGTREAAAADHVE